MSDLTPRDRELLALGAAMGSNCVPCIEHHIREARESGLSDAEIGEAIRLADTVRRVPARKVLDAAQKMLPQALCVAGLDDNRCVASGTRAEGAARCCG